MVLPANCRGHQKPIVWKDEFGLLVRFQVAHLTGIPNPAPESADPRPWFAILGLWLCGLRSTKSRADQGLTLIFEQRRAFSGPFLK